MEPVLVVAGGQILGGRHPLDGVAELVDVVVPSREGGDEHPEHAPLPVRVEDRLILLASHGAPPLHCPKVLDPVHVLPPSPSAPGGGPSHRRRHAPSAPPFIRPPIGGDV